MEKLKEQEKTIDTPYIPTLEEYEQALINRFTLQVYEKFKNAKVGIAGLGGLGSNIAVMLARTGIGHLHLIDFDKVDITNLNRQAYSTRHLNMPKTEALKEILKDINPYCKVTTDTIRLDKENVPVLLGTYPIVCEAFDNADNKAMLVNTLFEECPGVKMVSGSGMAGYGSSNDIYTKKVMKNLYVSGDRVSDIADVSGLLSSRVSVVAGHQANMVIRLILGIEEV